MKTENAEVLEMTVKRVESVLRDRAKGKRVTDLSLRRNNVSDRACDVTRHFLFPQKPTA